MQGFIAQVAKLGLGANVGGIEAAATHFRDIRPGTEYDAKYIEVIPPVSVEVTRRLYLKGHCANCGKVIRHSQGFRKIQRYRRMVEAGT
mgnify:FL=1